MHIESVVTVGYNILKCLFSFPAETGTCISINEVELWNSNVLCEFDVKQMNSE